MQLAEPWHADWDRKQQKYGANGKKNYFNRWLNLLNGFRWELQLSKSCSHPFFFLCQKKRTMCTRILNPGVLQVATLPPPLEFWKKFVNISTSIVWECANKLKQSLKAHRELGRVDTDLFEWNFWPKPGCACFWSERTNPEHMFISLNWILKTASKVKSCQMCTDERHRVFLSCMPPGWH